MDAQSKTILLALFIVACLHGCGKGGVSSSGPPKLSVEEAVAKCEQDVPRAVGPADKYDNEDQMLDAWDKAMTNCMRFQRYECSRTGNSGCNWTPLS